MKTVLSLLIPALLLAYYGYKIRSSGQASRLLVGLLAGGTGLYYIGMLIARVSPGQGTTLQLAGACLFFTAVAFQTPRRQTPPPLGVKAEEEDYSTPPEE